MPAQQGLLTKRSEQRMTKKSLTIGRITISWLRGGDFRLDGGTMFGPVPKILWEQRIQATADNTIPMVNDPLLIRTPEHNIIVDSGLGNKLTAKQETLFQVTSPWKVIEDLAALGLRREDIDLVILTHFDFDHGGGVVMQNKRGQLELTFPKAQHLIQKSEWEDVLAPCRRAQSTYWPINFETLAASGQLKLITGDKTVCPGVSVRHSGGHTRGHQVVEIASEGQLAVHMGDLFPTAAHSNPLWVMAYDNFPLSVIEQKEQLMAEYRAQNAWFTFYHDPQVLACRLDERNRVREQWVTAS